MSPRVVLSAVLGVWLVAAPAASAEIGDRYGFPRGAEVLSPRPAEIRTSPLATAATDTANTSAADRAVAALCNAAAEPGTENLEALIRVGAPVNGFTPHRETPLQSAAAAGRDANVTALLAHGAQIDALAARGITALGWAARNGWDSTVRTLLDAGADPDAAVDASRAPLPLAAARDHEQAAVLLMERGSKFSEKPELAAAVLIALGDATSASLVGTIVPHLVGMVTTSPAVREAAADVITTSSTPISESILRELGPAAATRDFQTALLFAALTRGRDAQMSSALESGADVNAHHPRLGTPLSIAVSMGNPGVVGLLLAAGADRKSSGADEARLQVLAGDTVNDREAAELSATIDAPDVRNADGETLLFRAAQRGNFLAVKALLDKHADVAATVQRWPGDSGWTALMIAAAGGQAPVVQALLRAGAPVDQRNGAGRTALAFAAFYGRSQVVKLLLAAGADPDLADVDGQTPRILAAAGGDGATLALLFNSQPRATSAAAAESHGHAATSAGSR